MIRKTDYTEAIQTLTHSLAVLREAQEVEQNLEQLKAERDRLVREIEALRQQEAQEAAQHEASMAQRQREERVSFEAVRRCIFEKTLYHPPTQRRARPFWLFQAGE